MSKVIRHSGRISTVLIGEADLDYEREALAEQKLGEVFPKVNVITNPDGTKFIPVQEVFKIDKVYREELERAYQQGYDKGYQTGLAQGRGEGKAEAEKILGHFEQAIRDAVNQRKKLLTDAKRKVLELVIQISKKVTFDAIQIDPEKTLAMISGVIDTLIDKSKLKIKVHPDHLPIVEQNIDKFVTGSAMIKEISIEPDPRVRYGGCMIETPSGDVDARLESQFEVIQEAILADEEQP